jgi:hypothetical protein
MSKENKSLLLNLAIILVIALGFVLMYQAYVPTTSLDKMMGYKVNLETVELTGDKPEGLISKSIVKKGNKEIGTLYLINIKNDYYLNEPSDSMIAFNLVITADKLVYVDVLTVNQSSWARQGIINYMKEEFDGIEEADVKHVAIYNVADMDASSGATSKDSTTSVKETILKVLDFHNGVTETVYDILFGENYTFGSKDEINSGVIKHSYTVTGTKTGKVYYLEDSGYFNGPDSEIKKLGVRLILDDANKLIGYDFDDAEIVYEHTKGFQTYVKTFLDGFIGTDITTIASGLDTTTGASFSKALTYSMLLEFSTYLKGE